MHFKSCLLAYAGCGRWFLRDSVIYGMDDVVEATACKPQLGPRLPQNCLRTA